MKFFSWFTSKVRKGAENAEDERATTPTLALPSTATRNVSEVARRFSETAQLFSDTLREKGDLLRDAQERLDQHKESQKALEQALVEVTTSKAQAELDLEKMEDDRKQIMNQMQAIDQRMKRKREDIDELESDLKRAREDFEQGEKETPRLEERMDAEQHDHKLLVSTSIPATISTSIPTIRKLDYLEDTVGEENRLALVAVEPVKPAEPVVGPTDSAEPFEPVKKEKPRPAAIPSKKGNSIGKDTTPRKYRKSAKVAKVAKVAAKAEEFPRVTLIESCQGQPTSVRVISADGSEETYRTGEYVHIMWQGHKVMFDGVSYTKFLNAACFGQIETMGQTKEGIWKFGLKCFYFSHFTVAGEKHKRSSQHFLTISDEVWKRNNVRENDIFRSREKIEFLPISVIDGKVEMSHEDIQKHMRLQYDYVTLSPGVKKKCGMLCGMLDTIVGCVASKASESPPESTAKPPSTSPSESSPESPVSKIISGLDDVLFEKDTPVIGILRPKNKKCT